jgi:hypothetical protein
MLGSKTAEMLCRTSAVANTCEAKTNESHMADDYSVDGKEHGPVSAAELRKLAAGGRLRSDHLVWKSGLPKWIEARKVKGLFQDGSPPNVIIASPAAPSRVNPPSSATNAADQKQCPYCGEQILAVAKKCRFCGEWLDKSQRIKRFAVPIHVVPVWNIPFFILFTLYLYWVFWIYRIFKELHAREFTTISPGTAVGCMFIPFYNFYWLFAVFAELKKAVERAYESHHQPVPPTGWVWVMPVVWFPGSILAAFVPGAGSLITLTGASLTLCFVQSWMNHIAAIEQA